ncbi:MAG: hypothetical protein LBG74_03905 [Spirochaetaceae bacterium]|jgi:hypothetical protein|nr:hypothetical protein [Spirochaetaceae bacterium]
MKKLILLFLCCGIFPAQAARAMDFGVSVSPLTLLGAVLSSEYTPTDNPRDYIWISADLNFLLDDSRERSIGIVLQPNCYGLRYHQRKYTNDNHSGFLYGLFATLDYRVMGWKYNDQDGLTVSYAFIGNTNTTEGMIFHTIGATIGANTGFRLRGERWGATFYVGAGVPLIYCFGDLPRKQNSWDLYFGSALNRAFELGLKIDFYI